MFETGTVVKNKIFGEGRVENGNAPSIGAKKGIPGFIVRYKVKTNGFYLDGFGWWHDYSLVADEFIMEWNMKAKLGFSGYSGCWGPVSGFSGWPAVPGEGIAKGYSGYCGLYNYSGYSGYSG